MFDAPPQALLVSTKTNGKNNKKDDSIFSFGAALLAPPKSGGVGGFYFSSSYAINRGTISISGDKGAEEKKEDASSAPADDFSFGVSAETTPAVIASAGVATAASGLSFGAPPPCL